MGTDTKKMESAPNMCNIPLEADNVDDSFIETSFEIGKNYVLNTVEHVKNM